MITIQNFKVTRLILKRTPFFKSADSVTKSIMSSSNSIRAFTRTFHSYMEKGISYFEDTLISNQRKQIFQEIVHQLTNNDSKYCFDIKRQWFQIDISHRLLIRYHKKYFLIVLFYSQSKKWMTVINELEFKHQDINDSKYDFEIIDIDQDDMTSNHIDKAKIRVMNKIHLYLRHEYED